MAEKRILVVAGTGPAAIKLAPVVLEARRRAGVEVLLCNTAQHRTLVTQALDVFGLKPDIDLDVMLPGQTLAGLTSRLFARLPDALAQTRPDVVVVQGDTTTVFAGALCAFYERIPVAHVEAGLRTDDPYAPFPEEINRRLVGQVARWHFAPTEGARHNLLRDGVSPDRVHVTGNTVVDALLTVAAGDPQVPAALDPGPGRRLVLVTGHRRENFGEGLRGVCGALADIARAHPDTDIVYLVHPNPNVEGPVRELLGGCANVRLAPPTGYGETVALMKRAALIITDSGGIQEEAPALGVPVLVTRDVTERPECVESGCARLVGTDRARIVSAAAALLDDPAAHARMARAANPFGDGTASRRILDVLLAEGA